MAPRKEPTTTTSKIRDKIALILPGGGARCAYQAGVLRAIAEWLPDNGRNPYSIVCGTSAGSINAVSVAANAHRHRVGIERLAGVWSNLTLDRVLRTQWWYLYGTALRWLLALTLGGLGERNPRSLFDNSPLRDLLAAHLNFSRAQFNVLRGNLRALAITATGYDSGHSVAFFNADSGEEPWLRARREGKPTHIDVDHVMASLALPFLFPAVRLGDEYFGDGSLRERAPFSTAIHLGAHRMLVIGTRNDHPPDPALAVPPDRYPTLGQLGGYILDTLFMDGFAVDLEHLDRVNELVTGLQPKRKETVNLRPLVPLILVPSEDLRVIAQKHLDRFPRAIRHVLAGIGGLRSGSSLASFLLFDGAFCGELVKLGHADATRRKEIICSFLFEPAGAS